MWKRYSICYHIVIAAQPWGERSAEKFFSFAKSNLGSEVPCEISQKVNRYGNCLLFIHTFIIHILIYSKIFQTLFDPMFIALYNLFYTSMPVLALGIFDQDVSDVNSLNYPKLYVAGQRNLLFNKAEFIKSAFHGFITSCVIFSIPYGEFPLLTYISINEVKFWVLLNVLFVVRCFLGTYKDGISPKGYILSDHMLLGSVVSTILVIVVTAQVSLTSANSSKSTQIWLRC